MNWARVLAYVTGTVDQELLARNEYLAAENRILKAKLNGRPKLSDAERATLGEIGHRLGRNALTEVATVARPGTILAWYRKLVASKFDGSKARRGPGRPRITRELVAAQEEYTSFEELLEAQQKSNPLLSPEVLRRVDDRLAAALPRTEQALVNTGVAEHPERERMRIR